MLLNRKKIKMFKIVWKSHKNENIRGFLILGSSMDSLQKSFSSKHFLMKYLQSGMS